MLSLVASLAGLVLPPAFDFIKKKFLRPDQDTPEATMSTLATTNPDVLDKFVLANVELLRAKKEFFNRDVVGKPSLFIIDLRAAIRPAFVVLSLSVRCLGWAFHWNIDESFNAMMDMCITSWFSSRLL